MAGSMSTAASRLRVSSLGTVPTALMVKRVGSVISRFLKLSLSKILIEVVPLGVNTVSNRTQKSTLRIVLLLNRFQKK